MKNSRPPFDQGHGERPEFHLPPHYHHPHDGYDAPPPPSPPHHGAVLPPYVRNSVVNAVFDEEMTEKLEATYGDALPYVLNVIGSAPAEIKLTLAMLLGFKVDLSACSRYVSRPVKFASPLFNSAAKEALGNILGMENLANALYIYNTSPAEQALIAVTVAMLIRDLHHEDAGAVSDDKKGVPQNGSAENDS